MKKLIMLIFTTYTLSLTPCFSQNIITIAGNGDQGFSGDGLPATSNFCELNYPQGVYIDRIGNVYIGDEINDVVRIINTNGIISTFAGNPFLNGGYSGDNGPATAAQLNSPVGVSGDKIGNIYIADYANSVIREVNTSGIITTVAGTGIHGFSGDGGQATVAELYGPLFLFVDVNGNIFIPDVANRRIREVNNVGVISTVAGNGVMGFSGDSGPATVAELSNATGVCVDSVGNIYITDGYNSRIRKVNSLGIISTIAGSGTAGYSGDGGQADLAELDYPIDVNIDTYSNIFITDAYNQRIRKIDASGIITTIAGNGYNSGSGSSGGYFGDGGPATSAELGTPTGISLDSYDNVYFSDQGNQRIREIVYVPTGIAYIENKKNFNIYPNPTNQKLNIVFNQQLTGLATLTIMDITGREVITEQLTIDNEQLQIDVSSLSTGMYLISLKNRNIFITQKFIKQ